GVQQSCVRSSRRAWLTHCCSIASNPILESGVAPYVPTSSTVPEKTGPAEKRSFPRCRIPFHQYLETSINFSLTMQPDLTFNYFCRFRRKTAKHSMKKFTSLLPSKVSLKKRHLRTAVHGFTLVEILV